MTSANVFSASDMLSALRAGTFAPALSVTCVVKHDDTHHNVLLINLKMSCVGWIPIPLEVIDTIEYVRSFTCEDHTHPIVRLTFARPTTPEGKAFATVATQLIETKRARDLEILPPDSEINLNECIGCLNRCSDLPTRDERVFCFGRCPCGSPM